ncbi:polycystic kidney disease 2-like 2 protein [Fukomys damarensis]|uniref:polycystic kidney disease 2-like 2 protein n=1 Tax=Fukomys damarensis TaxID=885580 RepID=UPI00145503F3|nr:polycystic kidney disease 2-like 2 protein [Fukomys damarensis]
MVEASHRYRGGPSKHKLHYRKEVEIRTTLQELLLYLIFLINLCILTFGMVNTHMYYFNKVISSLFLDTSVPGDERTNFKSICSITDFWKFMEGPLLEGLYWDSWYNNQKLYNLRNSSRIHYENILLGVPRVRQLKVRNNTCKVHSSFQALMSECYGKYTSENEDLSDFGIKSGTDWTHSTSNTNSPWHWGFVGVYQNGGYIFTLSKSKSETKNKFTDLRLNSWITRGTRVIFIDFSLYNANVNLFCIVRFCKVSRGTGLILATYLSSKQEIQRAEPMKKWKEKLEKRYYSTELQDDYQPVTQQEFHKLFLYVVAVEKELEYISLKLNRVMRKCSALQH